jgi:TfoX/Sxy family transcriptional regulator of competence genes
VTFSNRGEKMSDTLTARVRAALMDVPDVEERKMFGGITFMVNGKMCVSVGARRLMCRIDPRAHEAALQRKGCRTVVMKGREYRGYVHVDAEAVTKQSDLRHWIDLALDFNGRAKSSRKRRPPPRPNARGNDA